MIPHWLGIDLETTFAGVSSLKMLRLLKVHLSLTMK
jgi:hypothetical protein